MRITPGDQLLNARLAAEIGPMLTPADRRDIANHWDVSVRTVERWFGLGLAQQIAFVHPGSRDRREWAQALLDAASPNENGIIFRDGAPTVPETYELPGGRRNTSLPRALEYAIHAPSRSAWDRETIYRTFVIQRGGRWYVEVLHEAGT